MELPTGQALELIDAQQRALGWVTLQGWEGDLLLGRFAPGADFPAVERLFRDFEDAANRQALRVIDELDAVIGAFGLRLCMQGGDPARITEVQIWSDGGMTCRLADSAAGVPIGDAHGARPAEGEHES